MLKNKHILYLFLLSSVLLMLDIFLYWNYKISFAGFYTDCVVFWVWILSFLGIIIVYWKKLMAKISLGLLFLGIILSLSLIKNTDTNMLFPTISIELFLDKKLNDKYRFRLIGDSIDLTGIGYIMENKFWIFEKELPDKTFHLNIHIHKDVRFISEDNESVHIKFSYEMDEKIYEDDEIVKMNKYKEIAN